MAELVFNNEDRETRKNQTIVITGAASGIGRECLRWFAREGYCCLGIDLSFDKEDELKKYLSVNSKDLSNVHLENCDVTNYDLLKRIIEKYEQKHGFIHCLINNAGVRYLHSIDKQNTNEWGQMMNVNIMGVLNGIRCVVDKMKEKKHGCIINIGDIGGHKHFENQTVYCATKRAVQGITEGIRCELYHHGVKVIAINPGAVETPSFVHSTDRNIEKQSYEWRDSLEHGLLQPEDVARCCLFAYQQPKRCLIREIQLAPIGQHQ